MALVVDRGCAESILKDEHAIKNGVDGLIIGMGSGHVLSIIRCPPPESTGEEEGNEFMYDPDDWLLKFAQNVSTMLPGGISVIGVFIHRPMNIHHQQLATSAVNIMRPILSRQLDSRRTNSNANSCLLFHLGLGRDEILCKKLSLDSNPVTSKDVEIKYAESLASKLVRFETVIDVNMIIQFPSKSKRKSEMGLDTADLIAIEKLLQSWLVSDRASLSSKFIVTPSGSSDVINPDSLIEHSGNVKSVDFHFFEPAPFCGELAPNQTGTVHSTTRRILGKCKCVGYAFESEKFSEGINALLSDMQMTMLNRVRLLHEDAADNGSESLAGNACILPLRFGYLLDRLNILVSDYLLGHETGQDIIFRGNETFGMTLRDADIVQMEGTVADAKKYFGPQEVQQGDQPEQGNETGDVSAASNSIPTPIGKRRNSPLGVPVQDSGKLVKNQLPLQSSTIDSRLVVLAVAIGFPVLLAIIIAIICSQEEKCDREFLLSFLFNKS